MRKIVTEWMLDVCLDSRCHVDVFLLATNIMDRFLATIRLQKKQFQLLGAASIFLASKMIEPQPISALTLVRNTADTYDREELLVSKILFFIMILRPLTIGRVIELLNNNFPGLSPSGGFASLLFDQVVPKNSKCHLADWNAIYIFVVYYLN